MVEESGYGEPPAHLDARILELFAYWKEKAGDRAMPDRRDLDPVLEKPHLVSAMWLLNVERNPMRFQYRLLGNELVTAGVVSKTGQYVDQQPQIETMNEIIRAFQLCAEEGRTFWRRGKPRLVHDKFVNSLQNLVLPLTHKGSKKADLLMNMTIYEWMTG